MLALGFGFVEVGTVTPLPQAGNPRPRLFRLAEDRAVINRMGFNNRGPAGGIGAACCGAAGSPASIGVNVGANKDSTDRIADYVSGVRTMAPVADYLRSTSARPTRRACAGCRTRARCSELLAAVQQVGAKKPVFLQGRARSRRTLTRSGSFVPPSTTGIDALIVSNTTVSRPPLRSRYAAEAGGLSGAPLKPLALEALREFRRASGGEIPLIGVGGIATAEDAWERIRAGASLVQLYTRDGLRRPGIARADRRRAGERLSARRLRQHCRGGRERIAAARHVAACCLSFLVAAAAHWRRSSHRPASACPRADPGGHGMVSAADPRAAAAGVEMLRPAAARPMRRSRRCSRSTSSSRKARASAAAAFFIRGDGRTHRLATIDGRETRPGGRDPNWFMGPGGKPLPPRQMRCSAG